MSSDSVSRVRVGRLWPLALLALVGLYLLGQGSFSLLPAAEAPAAPDLVVSDLEGNEIRLADLRGQVVLLNLWASWCGPCRREVPRISRIQAEFAARGLVVWGISAESLENSELEQAANSLGIDYPVVRPVQGLTGPLAGEGMLPHNWLIDRQGRVRASHAGLAGESALRRACLELLEEP